MSSIDVLFTYFVDHNKGNLATDKLWVMKNLNNINDYRGAWKVEMDFF